MITAYGVSDAFVVHCQNFLAHIELAASGVSSSDTIGALDLMNELVVHTDFAEFVLHDDEHFAVDLVSTSGSIGSCCDVRKTCENRHGRR